MPLARPDGAHSVAHIHPVDTACAFDGPVMNREGDGIPLGQPDHFHPGLHSGALLGEYKLSALKVLTGTGKKSGHLNGEDVLTVEILVQAVEISSGILE